MQNNSFRRRTPTATGVSAAVQGILAGMTITRFRPSLLRSLSRLGLGLLKSEKLFSHRRLRLKIPRLLFQAILQRLSPSSTTILFANTAQYLATFSTHSRLRSSTSQVSRSMPLSFSASSCFSFFHAPSFSEQSLSFSASSCSTRCFSFFPASSFSEQSLSFSEQLLLFLPHAVFLRAELVFLGQQLLLFLPRAPNAPASCPSRPASTT